MLADKTEGRRLGIKISVGPHDVMDIERKVEKEKPCGKRPGRVALELMVDLILYTFAAPPCSKTTTFEGGARTW